MSDAKDPTEPPAHIIAEAIARGATSPCGKSKRGVVIYDLSTNDFDLVHVKVVDGALVPSGGPSCVECSKLILAIDVSGVWLFHADGWRRYTAAEFHRLTLKALGLPLTIKA